MPLYKLTSLIFNRPTFFIVHMLLQTYFLSIIFQRFKFNVARPFFIVQMVLQQLSVRKHLLSNGIVSLDILPKLFLVTSTLSSISLSSYANKTTFWSYCPLGKFPFSDSTTRQSTNPLVLVHFDLWISFVAFLFFWCFSIFLWLCFYFFWNLKLVIKNIILIYFKAKNTLKNNHYYIFKHPVIDHTGLHLW